MAFAGIDKETMAIIASHLLGRWGQLRDCHKHMRLQATALVTRMIVVAQGVWNLAKEIYIWQ